METTLRKIKECYPCVRGWKKLLSNVNNNLDAKLTIEQILDSNGIEDAVWALRAVSDQKKVRLFMCDVAESVLYIFEERYPDDKRPREAIEASRKFANGKITKEELQKFEDAAHAATNVAFDDNAYAANDAAYAAADTTADTADAAAHAAYTVVRDVAHAADAKKTQWSKIKELLLKY